MFLLTLKNLPDFVFEVGRKFDPERCGVEVNSAL